MEKIFEICCEIEASEKSEGFFFGDRSEHDGDGDFNWCGTLYVMATDAKSAMIKFTEYINSYSSSCKIESMPVIINKIENYMHLWAIRERNDMEKLQDGKVVQGWGF